MEEEEEIVSRQWWSSGRQGQQGLPGDEGSYRSVKAARTAMATTAASVTMKEARLTLVWAE